MTEIFLNMFEQLSEVNFVLLSVVIFIIIGCSWNLHKYVKILYEQQVKHFDEQVARFDERNEMQADRLKQYEIGLKQQSDRTDKLYEMFVDLLKEQKNKDV